MHDIGEEHEHEHEDEEDFEIIDTYEVNLNAAAEITAAAASDAGEFALNNPEKVAALLTALHKAIGKL
jgi:ABC-type nitrate/sulfonate/bicarbonate transport system substrate-binding protein